MATRYQISWVVILKISPTKIAEYLLKFPPAERIARPIATEQDENTEIMVSVDATLRLLILFRRKNYLIDGGCLEDIHQPKESIEQHIPLLLLQCENRHRGYERIG